MGEPARNRPETILGNLGAGGLEGFVWQFLDGCCLENLSKAELPLCSLASSF